MGISAAHQKVNGVTNGHHCTRLVCDSCPELHLLPTPKKL